MVDLRPKAHKAVLRNGGGKRLGKIRRTQAKIAVFLQKTGDDGFVFLPGEGTGAIDQFSARLYGFGGGRKNPALQSA